MQRLSFTDYDNTKGFVFSVDSAVAIIMVITALSFFALSQNEPALSSSETTTLAEGTVQSLENNGYLLETIDTNIPADSAYLIREQILNALGKAYDANVSVTSYTVNYVDCAAQQTFEACFPDSNKTTGISSGLSGNESKEIAAGRKYFLTKEPPGDCNLSYIQFEEEAKKILKQIYEDEKADAYFSDAYFAGEDLNVSFNVTVDPSGSITCDQDVNITLEITVPEYVRKPIDLMLIIDRSGSMSWNGVVDTSDAGSVWVNGNYAFLDDGSSGVRSIDISTPLLPSLLDRQDPGTVNDVYGEGDYVYVTETYSTDELVVYDASNPNSMSETDYVRFDYLYGLVVQNDLVYVAGNGRASGATNGLYIVDASNKNNLLERGGINLSNSAEVAVSGNTAYLARGTSGVTSIDVTDPDVLVELDTITPGGSAQGLFILGDVMYAALGSSGVASIDITNPNSMSLLDTYNTPGNAYKVFADGNQLFVADGSSLQILDITDPANITFTNSFATPYNYYDVAVQGNYAYLAAGSLGFMVLDITKGPRINNAKTSSKQFVDFNGWTLPPDQMGLASFNTSASLDQTLTSDRNVVKDEIDLLTAGGGTNIESGIDAANTELVSVRANPNAIKFEVLLSDGQSNSGNSASAASDAAADGIIIFTIGFGADADVGELTTIANLTGGEYYYASDENALSEVFQLIAYKVQELANDSNVTVPVSTGTVIVDDGNGMVYDGNIVFDSGTITPDSPFVTSYILNFPCLNSDVCGIDAVTFPGTGTTFTYTNSEGEIKNIDFNASETLSFNSRNLALDIIGGEIIEKDNVSLDVAVENVGELDANATDIKFYLDNPSGIPLAIINVPALCSVVETPGCLYYSEVFPSIDIDTEGVIYAVLNDSNTISECPLNNTDAVNCYGGPLSEVFIVDYAIWRK